MRPFGGTMVGVVSDSVCSDLRRSARLEMHWALVFGVALMTLVAPGCAGSKRAPKPASASASRGVSYDKSFDAARTQKYVEMYRAYRHAEERADGLESRLGAQEKEVAQLRDQLNVALAGGGSTYEPAEAEETGGGGGSMAVRPARGGGRSRTVGGDPAQVAQLRAALEQAETQLKRLRAETSSGPFEKGPKAALHKAYEEIDQLKAQLVQERQSREQMARDFETLKAQTASMQAPAVQPAAVAGHSDSRMNEQLQHMLQTIERDLASSRQREEELKVALVQAQAAQPKADATSGATVATLKTENGTLQSALEEAHRKNKELSAKLAAASRVADLVFKMKGQSGAPQAR